MEHPQPPGPAPVRRARREAGPRRRSRRPRSPGLAGAHAIRPAGLRQRLAALRARPAVVRRKDRAARRGALLRPLDSARLRQFALSADDRRDVRARRRTPDRESTRSRRRIRGGRVPRARRDHALQRGDLSRLGAGPLGFARTIAPDHRPSGRLRRRSPAVRRALRPPDVGPVVRKPREVRPPHVRPAGRVLGDRLAGALVVRGEPPPLDAAHCRAAGRDRRGSRRVPPGDGVRRPAGARPQRNLSRGVPLPPGGHPVRAAACGARVCHPRGPDRTPHGRNRAGRARLPPGRRRASAP